MADREKQEPALEELDKGAEIGKKKKKKKKANEKKLKKKKSNKKNILEAPEEEVNVDMKPVTKEEELPPLNPNAIVEQKNIEPVTPVSLRFFEQVGENAVVKFAVTDVDTAWACVRDVESWMKVLTLGKATINLLNGKAFSKDASYLLDMSYDGNTSNFQKFTIVEINEKELKLDLDVLTGSTGCVQSTWGSKKRMVMKVLQTDGTSGILVITLPIPPINSCRKPTLFSFAPCVWLCYLMVGKSLVSDALKSHCAILKEHFDTYVYVPGEIPQLETKKSRSRSMNVVPKLKWPSMRSSSKSSKKGKGNGK